MSDTQQRAKWRLLALCVVGAALLLLLLIGGLWFAYHVADRHLVPHGPKLIYSLKTGADPPGSPGTAHRCVDVIKKRIQRKPARVRFVEETGRIEVHLPRMKGDEVEAVRKRIEPVGRVKFSLVNTDGADCARASEGKPVPGYTPFVEDIEAGRPTGRYAKRSYEELADMDLRAEDWLGVANVQSPRAALVNSEPEITGAQLDPDSVRSTEDESGLPAVAFAFKPEARRQFQVITARNMGRHLAIIVDDIVYSAPVIQGGITGRGVISSPGGFAEDELDRLLAVLGSGELPAELALEEIVPAEPRATARERNR